MKIIQENTTSASPLTRVMPLAAAVCDRSAAPSTSLVAWVLAVLQRAASSVHSSSSAACLE
jgi:hypothetical protein